MFLQTLCVFGKKETWEHEITNTGCPNPACHVLIGMMISESWAGISEHSTNNNPLSWKHSGVSVILQSTFPGRQFWIFSTHPSSPFIISFESSMHSSVLWDRDTADLDTKFSCRALHTTNLRCFEECGSRWLFPLWWSSYGDVGGNSESPSWVSEVCSGPLHIGGSEKSTNAWSSTTQAVKNLPSKAKCHPGPLWSMQTL